MIWTIPADKTKKRREFIVPLTTEMSQLLTALKQLKLNDYLFPGEKQEHVHRETVLKALKRLKVDSTAHGFRALARSLFRRDWSIRLGIAGNVPFSQGWK